MVLYAEMVIALVWVLNDSCHVAGRIRGCLLHFYLTVPYILPLTLEESICVLNSVVKIIQLIIFR